jgi:hypothetical protein
MRQSIQLTGLDTPTFSLAIENIFKIHSLFERSLPDHTLQAWQPTQIKDNVASIDMSNRYFTDRREAAHTAAIPISYAMDPQGILAMLMGQDFIHSSENEVQYYELVDLPDGTKK